MQIHFFWHMHQPSYIKNGIIDMPWVFLHAIKDYFDMPYLIEKTGSKATFNITATLIEQLKIYESEPLRDRFLASWIKPPNSLEGDEKAYILKVIQSINPNLVINGRFGELLKFDILSQDEFIDLEVLFMLSWCGVYLKGELKGFLSKPKYTQNDKEYLFDYLVKFIQTILPYYNRLAQEERISLFTTPYTHPILPLLLNMENAKYANPSTQLPPNPISLRDDAVEHIKRAKSIYHNTFSKDTVGFWPAEGAVDEESVRLYSGLNIRYIATDEEILHRSGEANHHRVYNRNGVIIFFRDHTLSDLIGFKYRFLNEKEAVEDFISKLNPNGEVVSVIVDGENAWEFYRDGGYSFLELLYTKLQPQMVRAEDISLSQTVELNRLVSGSWIYGNFNTWVGDKEKNLAWEYLFEAKRAYLKSQISNPKIDEKFLLAECSDWFWWYGEGHNTEFAKEFDELFRGHLKDIYLLMELPIPKELYIPIIEEENFSYMSEPKNEISPVINGRFGSIFEWYGAGIIDETKLYSTMDRRKLIEKIYFGMDSENFYFALYGDISEVSELSILFEELDRRVMVTTEYNSNGIEVKKDTIIEIRVAKSTIELNRVYIRFEVEDEVLPSFGGLLLDKNLNCIDNWFV